MKKILKKTIASVVAGVTLAVGMTAMSSSAADVTVYFSPQATASVYRSSTTISASTSCTAYCYTNTVFVRSTTGGSITSGYTSKTTYNGYETASINCKGQGFTSVSTTHKVETSDYGSGSKDLTV